MTNKKVRTQMKVIKGEERNKDFYPFISLYTEDELFEECSRCLNCPKPLCKEGCPINNRIPEFISKAKEGDYASAFEIISDNSIMPDICGTVCPHSKQCEGNCIRNKIDEPIAIGAIERFIGEWAINNGLTKKNKVATNGKRVACVGAGPASMACAEKLLESGFEVTIYEAEEYVGGVLAWGIPSYRLPKENVEDHIKRLNDLGVIYKLNTRVGKDISLQEIVDEYDAVFLGVGAYIPNKMNVEGESLEGIYSSDEFLKSINLSPLNENGQREFNGCGKNVLVIGGGNVAMDAARDAIRLAQVETVTIVYRRTEEEMPAAMDELEHAKEEGVKFMTLHNPVAFHGDDGHVSKAECAVMELGEADESGRRSPHETDKPHIFLDVDTVVMALGYKVDASLSKEVEGLEINKWGCFEVDEEGRTSLNKVYAGGDAVSGAETVVKAMKAGLLAAETIKKDLL